MSAIDRELHEAEKKLVKLRKRIVDLRKQRKHELVKDYILNDLDGNEVTLSSLLWTRRILASLLSNRLSTS